MVLMMRTLHEILFTNLAELLHHRLRQMLILYRLFQPFIDIAILAQFRRSGFRDLLIFHHAWTELLKVSTFNTCSKVYILINLTPQKSAIAWHDGPTRGKSR